MSKPPRVFDLDDTVVPTSFIQGDKTRAHELALVPGGRECLEQSVRNGHRTVLLTYSDDKEYQQKKLAHLGLNDLSGLEIRIVAAVEDKKLAIEDIVKESGCLPQEIVVVGDHPRRELLYGWDVGCTVVRVRLPGGKYGAEECVPGKEPHLTVEDLQDPRLAQLLWG